MSKEIKAPPAVDRPENTLANAADAALGEDILSKYDREAAFRKPKGPIGTFCFWFAVIWSLVQLYTALFGTFPSTLQRAPHIGAGLILIYLLYPMNKNRFDDNIPWYDYVLALLSVGVSGYHVFLYDQLQLRSGMFTKLDLIVSVTAVLLVLEAARRICGPIIVSLASFFILYAYFGKYFPGFLVHRGLSVERIATTLWLGTEGILGSPIYVSSTFIFLFLLFATFLKKSGVGDWMTGLAMGTCGGAIGGPAKAAVVASALQGTLTGSSVANTVSTGSITIPLMKKTGYRPEFAGAVEAAASTGGQIMPPVMGAAAFIMTEYVGVPYSTVALAACVPALLYFTGIFTNVHFEALKNGLLGIPDSERPDSRKLMKNGWYMVFPIFVITFLLLRGYTAMLAALYGIFSCVLIWIVEIVRSDTGKRFDLKKFVWMTIEALEEGARSALSVVAACATAGIIVGVITMTGLGLKLAGGIVDLAGGSLILTMILTMFTSILLGMGVPTTANYIIQATISAPAMISLGVVPIAAHMFVFYFGIVADITPPVALAAFAGAGIAGSNPMKTGFNAFKLGFAAYLVPYIFVMNPELVLVNVTGYSSGIFALLVIKCIITAVIGMIGIATAMTGYMKVQCNLIERILLFIAGITLINPTTITDIIGIVLISAVYFWQTAKKKKLQSNAA